MGFKPKTVANRRIISLRRHHIPCTFMKLTAENCWIVNNIQFSNSNIYISSKQHVDKFAN